MESFCIELNNPHHCYNSGEEVTGTVIIKSDKPLIFKEVSLVLEGIGRAHWSLTETFTVNKTNILDGKTKITKHDRVIAYSESEKYVLQKVSLVGDNQSTLTLPVGTTTYPFSFHLPSNCPSTFHSNFGYVAYYLEAELKRYILKRNQKAKLSFTVNGIFDLNTEPKANKPQELQKVRCGSFFACHSGQMKFVLKIPRSGYIPGETLEFTSEITNHSNKKINGVSASLCQVVQYETKVKKTVKCRIICSVKGPEVNEGEHETYSDSIRIPTLPPTKLGGMCTVIDVQYCLRFEASIVGLSKPLMGEIPILIGTKSFRALSKESSPEELGEEEEGEGPCTNNGQEFTALCPTE